MLKIGSVEGLFKAAMYGDTKTVIDRLSEVEDMEIRKEFACKALFYAAWKNHFFTVSALIDLGADVNNQNLAGQTAIMYATRWNHKEIVEFLLQHGADIGICDNDQKTALDYATEGGHKEMVEMLEQIRDKSA